MADIELVIKIPEWKYKSICEGVEASKRCGVVGIDPNIHEAIYNSTPLPKGHGRIGDLDKIQSMAREKAENCFPEGRYDYGYRKALFDFAKDIDNTPTIIEADKESEE